MDFYPTELKTTSRPLIAALGNTDYQEKILSHIASINEEHVPRLHFLALPADHIFTPKKELREKHATLLNQTQRDFEGYKVLGILKSHWLRKHHEKLPSVVLFFDAFDPRWNQKDWMDQEAKLKDHVDKLRKALNPRECRVIVILVQQLDDTGLTPLNITEERLSSLRKRLETDSKMLILLRNRDIVRGSQVLVKLETMIRNAALEYYKFQTKRVKRYKKNLAKLGNSYQALHVRYSFKIAHYYEFRRCTTKVLQHYETSYRVLMQFAQETMNWEAEDRIKISQVKIVAEYINFKLCFHLLLSLNNVKGAVDQFHRHLHAFLSMAGPAERIYEHWEWVSRQYHVFAQLLTETASNKGALASVGLDSPVYKEPYLYYSIAAKYATYRRKSFAKLLGGNGKALTHFTETLSVTDFDVVTPVFVGGEPIVKTADSTAPSRVILKKYLDTKERAVNHADLAIQLLQQALHHVAVHVADQKSSRNRLKTRLLVHIGSENLAAHQYDRARLELEKAKTLYVSEHWYSLVAQVYKQLLICCFHQADTLGMIDVCLQLLSPVLARYISAKERQRLQEKMMIAWQDATQLRGPFAAKGAASIPNNSFKICLTPANAVFTCQMRFDRVAACVCDRVFVHLKLQSNLPSPITLTKAKLYFSNKRYNILLLQKSEVGSSEPEHIPRAETSDYESFYCSLEFASEESKCIALPLQILDEEIAFSYLSIKLYMERQGDMPCGKRPALVLTVSEVENVLRVCKSAKPFLLAERIPIMGKGPGSPSFARLKQKSTAMEIDTASSDYAFGSFEKDYSLQTLRAQRMILLEPKARARLELLTKDTLLAGDYRILDLRVASHEDMLQEATYQLACDPPPASTAASDAFFFDSELQQLILNPQHQPSDAYPLQDCDTNSEQRFRLIVRSMRAIPTTICVKLSYKNKNGVNVTMEERFKLPCVSPFILRGHFRDRLALRSESSDFVAVSGKPVTYHGSLLCQCNERIEVESCIIEENANAVPQASVSASHELSGSVKILQDNDQLSFALLLYSPQPLRCSSMGTMKIIWKRLHEEKDHILSKVAVCTQLKLPSVHFQALSVLISFTVPPHAVLGGSACLSLQLTNQESEIHSVRIKPQESVDFFFSGQTSIILDLLPWDSISLSLDFIPLKAGALRLPAFDVTLLSQEIELCGAENQLELYVLPPKE